MRTIVLPGFSPHNRVWADEVVSRLKDKNNGYAIYWEHWKKNKSASLSINKETDKIEKVLGDDEFNLVCKSVGTRVCIHFIPKHLEKVNKIILCGIPFNGLSDDTKLLYKQILSELEPQKVIVFQNKKDPFGNFDTVNNFISGISKNIKVVSGDRSDHDYPYFEDFSEFLG